MKLCKKCKKHVANKLKICKYCGADVSKAKIIKDDSNKNIGKVSKVINEKIEIKSIPVIEESYIYIEEYTTKKIQKRRKQKTRKQRIIKYAVLGFVICGVIGVCYFFGPKLLINSGIVPVNVVRKDDKKAKVFVMGDHISYNDVIYRVTKVEPSVGTSYFKPEDGNEYLIIHLEIVNRSNKKINFSYENWKMLNSLDEEKSRIFVPINVDSALYNGELVVGATKRGSIVFEQPIGDSGLILEFYDTADLDKLNIEEKTVEEVSKEKSDVKPVFKVRIDSPTKEDVIDEQKK